jgi:prophage DNA circulation protein
LLRSYENAQDIIQVAETFLLTMQRQYLFQTTEQGWKLFANTLRLLEQLGWEPSSRMDWVMAHATEHMSREASSLAEVLEELLRYSTDSTLRQHTAEILGELGQPLSQLDVRHARIVRMLDQALGKEPDPAVKRTLINVLASLGQLTWPDDVPPAGQEPPPAETEQAAVHAARAVRGEN